MTRRVGAVAVLMASVAGIATGCDGSSESADSDSSESADKKPIEFGVSDLFIETNATDGDTGLQLNLEGEKWDEIQIRDPEGQEELLDVRGEGELGGLGLTELFFESDEPPFNKLPRSEFEDRFPEGEYTFTGRTIGGRELVGSDTFSHVVPDGPVVTNPTEGERVDPKAFTVTWKPVTKPKGVEIARYIVVVTQENPVRTVEMYLRPDATSADVPAQFLDPGVETEVEVLAREKSGNQTITEVQAETK
jgi:hypothetical protein